MKIVVAPAPEQAASHAAAWIARRIRTAVRLRGVCRIAVSGGSTPAMMFDDLARMDMPWAAVHVFQVDERVAPDGDPDRNAGQLAAHLTSRVPIKPANLHLMPVTVKSLPRAAASYAAALGDAPLDIVHLGLGEDGHTASWPPGDPVVDAPGAVAICGMFNGRVRMTLTPRAVNAARARLMFVVGAGKAAPFAGWMLHDSALPVEHVKRTGTTVIVDVAAAGQLPAVDHLRRASRLG